MKKEKVTYIHTHTYVTQTNKHHERGQHRLCICICRSAVFSIRRSNISQETSKWPLGKPRSRKETKPHTHTHTHIITSHYKLQKRKIGLRWNAFKGRRLGEIQRHIFFLQSAQQPQAGAAAAQQPQTRVVFLRLLVGKELLRAKKVHLGGS